MIQIEFDSAKRELALKIHKVDFNDAPYVFDGPMLTRRDDRVDYGEPRYVTFGLFNRRMVVVVWPHVAIFGGSFR